MSTRMQERVNRMMGDEGPRMCDECQKPCELLIPSSRPQAAEWYCDPCHKSYPVHQPAMEEEEVG